MANFRISFRAISNVSGCELQSHQLQANEVTSVQKDFFRSQVRVLHPSLESQMIIFYI